MNNNIMKKMGFEKEVKLVKEKKCPFCKKQINEVNFKNELSKREYKISGLCQECQDKVFGE